MDPASNYCIYRHVTLPDLRPFYIGLAKGKNRPYHFYNRSKYWYEVTEYRQYRVDILMDGLTNEEAQEKEREFIRMYGRIDNKTGILVNRNSGGRGGNRRIWTNSQRAAQSLISKGRRHTPEAVKSMSEKQKGRFVPLERRRKMVETRIKNGGGKWVKSPEQIRKHQEAISGRILPSRFWVYKIDPVTKCVIGTFDGMTLAANSIGVHVTCIKDCLYGRQKTSGGFIWKRELKDGASK